MAKQTLSLAKALKVKNRQAQLVQNLQAIISRSNSRLVGAQVDFDVLETYRQLQIETERLVDIKSAINAANAPIQPLIYRMAELKGTASFLRNLDTKRGKHQQPYAMQEPQEYEAEITEADVDQETRRLEREIDDIQDALDRHNASTTVEIEIPEVE